MGAESAPALAGPACGVVLTMALCGQRGETSVSHMCAAVHVMDEPRPKMCHVQEVGRAWSACAGSMDRLGKKWYSLVHLFMPASVRRAVVQTAVE